MYQQYLCFDAFASGLVKPDERESKNGNTSVATHMFFSLFVFVSLQEAYDSVTADVQLSRREGWHFAAKLVRGAYMDQERERAAEIGYDDPINPDYESTSRMYHR